MPLILKIIAPSQLISGQAIEYTFDELGGSLGRKPSNDFILLDPERFISSKHATIEYNNHKYFITDTSTNGVFINNSSTPLGTGNSAELKDGDKITIGDFKLTCQLELAPTTSPPVPTPQIGNNFNPANEIETNFIENSTFDIGNPYEEPATLQPDFDPDIVDPLAILGGEPLAGLGREPLAGFGGEPLKDNSFDDINFPSTEAAPSLNEDLNDHLFNNPHETIPEPSVINEPFTPPSVIPDNWDIMGEANASEPLIKPAATPIPQADPPSSIPSNEKIFEDDDIFSNLNSVSTNNNSVDDFLSPNAVPTQKPNPSRSPSPSLSPSPLQNSVSPKTASPQQTPQKTPNIAAENELFDSFLKGAGINAHQLSNQDKNALMHKIGVLTRSSVEGLMVALRARSTIKSSFRVNKTSIAPVENNPLKFLVTADDALTTLLSDDKQGYMSAADAFNEGFKDLQTHQLALMAGMQATIKAIVTQFDPSNLERAFDNQGGTSLIPGQKKSKNWDSYTEFHARISNRLLDDFQHVYGEEFAHAYEAQINKLL